MKQFKWIFRYNLCFAILDLMLTIFSAILGRKRKRALIKKKLELEINNY